MDAAERVSAEMDAGAERGSEGAADTGAAGVSGSMAQGSNFAVFDSLQPMFGQSALTKPGHD